MLNSVFSRDVEDEVYCTLNYLDGATGQLCVNWSDESLRKMSTKVTVWGTNGPHHRRQAGVPGVPARAARGLA